MSNWSGFSDEDLKHVSSSSQKPHGYQHEKLHDKQVLKTSSLSEPRQKRVQKSVIKSSRAPAVGRDKLPSEMTTEMPTGAALSQPEKVNTKTGGSQQQTALVSTLPKEEENTNEKIMSLAEPCELDETEAFSRELSNVEKFQQRQREIEEANSRRRAMLKQAIDNRKKQTFAEQQKLVKIQRELDVLDSLVSADISLLRDKIEEASRDFLDAHKRYERAEKEFIESKVELHAKTETKEQLTEHLYTIIEENEERKARKLMELMASLDEGGSVSHPVGDAVSNTSPQCNMSGQQVAAKMTLINSVTRPTRVVSTGGGDNTASDNVIRGDDIPSQPVSNSEETERKGNNVCNGETMSPSSLSKHEGDIETVTQQNADTEDVAQKKVESEVDVSVKSNGEAGSHVVVMRGTQDDQQAREGSREPLMS